MANNCQAIRTLLLVSLPFALLTACIPVIARHPPPPLESLGSPGLATVVADNACVDVSGRFSNQIAETSQKECMRPTLLGLRHCALTLTNVLMSHVKAFSSYEFSKRDPSALRYFKQRIGKSPLALLRSDQEYVAAVGAPENTVTLARVADGVLELTVTNGARVWPTLRAKKVSCDREKLEYRQCNWGIGARYCDVLRLLRLNDSGLMMTLETHGGGVASQLPIGAYVNISDWYRLRPAAGAIRTDAGPR